MTRWLAPLIAGVLVGGIATAVAMALFFDEGSRSSLVVSARSSPETIRRSEASAPVEVATVARTNGDFDSSSPREEVIERATSIHHRGAAAPMRGSKVIKGRVTDRRSRPIAGVLVRATRVGGEDPDAPQRSVSGRGAPPAPTLDETIRKAVDAWYEKDSQTRETTTDADGRYVIPELRGGRFQVQAWRDGFTFQEVRGQGEVIEVRPDATVDFLARPAVLLQVAVTMPDGTSAPAALVWATKRGGENHVSSGWTPAEPTLALSAGEWEVAASLGDPQQGPAWPDLLTSENVDVTLAEDATPQPVTVTLKSEPGVRGQVTRADGSSLHNVLVRCLAQASGAADLKKLTEDPTTQSWWCQDGRYVFRKLKPGRHLVGASRDWSNRIVAHAFVDVGEGMAVQDLVIPELDPATCIVTTVVGPDGEAVAGAHFQWIVERDKQQNWQNEVMNERQEAGTWWLQLESASAGDFDVLKPWPPQTRLFLLTSAEGLGSTTVEIYQATRNVQVRFGPPATLFVTVPGLVGSSYAGRIHLNLARAGESAQRFGWGGGAQPDKDDGKAKIGPVEAGRYRLTMWLSANAMNRWSQGEVAATDVTLSPGDNHLALAIPQLYELVVRVPTGYDGRLSLAMIGKGNARTRGVEVKDGIATFGDLPAGDWRLTSSGGSTPGIMNLRVPAGGPVEFTPMAVNALRVAITDAAGLLTTSGFADGDLVVAVEGKEITSLLDWQMLQSASRVAKSVKLTVQRGAQKVELDLEARFVNDQTRLGGSLEPTTR